MSNAVPTVEELHEMIAALTKRLDAKAPPLGWSDLMSSARAAWLIAILVFSAGSTFAYYQHNVVMRDEFAPVKAAVDSLALVPVKIDRIEGFLIAQSTCSIHQSTYIRDLADYAAKVRRKPPVMNPAYRDCLSQTHTLEH